MFIEQPRMGALRMELRMREDMKQISERVARVEHGQAKLEGLLEGLREAITGRAVASQRRYCKRPVQINFPLPLPFPL